MLVTMPADDLDALDSLAIHRYRVDLALERSLDVPAHQRAVLWRGAFGAVFRSLVCHDLGLACEACPLRTVCPFPRVFAPSVFETRLAIARMRDPPRPFVLSDPHPAAPSLPSDAPLALGLTVVGTAVVELPYFVVALRRLGDDGIGRGRTRFRIDTVRCVDAEGLPGEAVYTRGSDLVRPVRVPMRARDLMRPGDEGAGRVRVRFVTPTDVRGGSTGVTASGVDGHGEAPAFGVLVRRARDRAGALATFFGGGPLGHDPRAVGAAADGVTVARAEIARTEIARRSARTGLRHPVGGVVGAVVYVGAGVAGAMPWLRLAEAIGVGKHATFGNGRIEVAVLG
jgi:hypothetical protein